MGQFLSTLTGGTTTTTNSTTEYNANFDPTIPATAYIQVLEKELQEATRLDISPLYNGNADDDETSQASAAAEFAQKLKNILDEHGFVVVENVLTPEECDKAELYFNADLANLVEIEHCYSGAPDDDAGGALYAMKTGDEKKLEWQKKRLFLKEDIRSQLLPNPAAKWPIAEVPLGRMFTTEYGMPCGKFAMHVRLNEKVRRVFYDVYKHDHQHFGDGESSSVLLKENMVEKEEELCVGLDSIFFTPTDPMVSVHATETAQEEKEKAAAREAEQEETQQKVLTGTSAIKKQKNLPEDRLWPHADMNTLIEGGQWDTYQSIVYVWGCNPIEESESEKNAQEEGDDGEHAAAAPPPCSATVVWPGSHKDVYNTMMEDAKEYASRSNHFVSLQRNRHREFIDKARRVPVPRGGMVFWNSKLIHQGWSKGPRLAQPVCYEPKSRRSAEALQRKEACVLEGQATSHWASLGCVHGAPASMYPLDEPPEVIRGFALRPRAHLHCIVAADQDGDGADAKKATIKPEILKWL